MNRGWCLLSVPSTVTGRSSQLGRIWVINSLWLNRPLTRRFRKHSITIQCYNKIDFVVGNEARASRSGRYSCSVDVNTSYSPEDCQKLASVKEEKYCKEELSTGFTLVLENEQDAGRHAQTKSTSKRVAKKGKRGQL